MESNQLSDLLQAEKKAETLRARSKEDSTLRIEKAHKDSEILLKKSEQSARDEAKQILEESHVNSMKEAMEIRAKGQSAVRDLRDFAESNTKKAVSTLLSNLDKAI